MKRAISLFCVLAIFLSMTPVISAVDVPVLQTSMTSGDTSLEKKITISLAGNANVGLTGLELHISYDQRLEVSQISAPKQLMGGPTIPQDYSLNPLNLIWSVPEADYGEGELATLTVRLPDEQEPGTYKYTINIAAEAYDNDLNTLELDKCDVNIQRSVTAPIQVIGMVELEGAVTTPVKNGIDNSSLICEGVETTIEWFPTLGSDNCFAANTEYTAKVIVSPADGWSFASNVRFVALEGFSEFKPLSDGTYFATRTFEITSDKEAPIAEPPSGLTAVYGDKLSGVALTNNSGNTEGSWAWKASPDTYVGNAGQRTHMAIFTPENTDDYTVVEKPVTITVNKADLTITGAKVDDKGYNNKIDDAVVTEVMFAGLVNGEEMAYGTDYTATGVYESVNAGDSVSVIVTVAFKENAKLQNYNLPPDKTILTYGKVIKAASTLSINVKSTHYTGLPFNQNNITVTSNVDMSPIYTYYNDDNGVKGLPVNEVPTRAGFYWVSGRIGETANNSSVESQPVRFEIEKAPLTIIANDKVITYGDMPDNNGVSYEGLVNNEAESVVTGLTYLYTYRQYDDAGEYIVGLSGAQAENYKITLKSGKLTVNKRDVDLTWLGHTNLYYDGKAKNVVAIATGAVNGDEVFVVVSGGTQKNIGRYTAKAVALTGNKAKNYQLPEIGNTQVYSIVAATENIVVTPSTIKALIDNNKLTISLIGYRGANEKVVLDGIIVDDGKAIINGVEYVVDMSGITVNEAGVTLTEAPVVIQKDETADESITDEAISAITGGATGSLGLNVSVAKWVMEEALINADIDAIEVSLKILPKAMTSFLLRLEIKPQVTYKSNGNIVKTEGIPNNAIKAPVTISVKLPSEITGTNFVAKHYMSNGKIEFIAVEFVEGIATWDQSDFSVTELIFDNRSVTVNYMFNNGGEQTVVYSAADIGKSFLEDSKSGSTFNGWTFDGDTTVYTVLTDELLDKLNGQTVNATSSFGSNGGGGSIGGASDTKKPVKHDTVNPFKDVEEDNYSYEAIMWAVENNVTSGISQVTFGPELNCTRAQAVTFLWRAAGRPSAKENANPFVDVSKSDYFYEAVLWGVESGITMGMTENTFCPDLTVTRGQIVTFIWRMEGKPKTFRNSGFNDISSSDYYADAVAWAVENEITNGTTYKTFSPRDNCTREQIVSFIYRNSNKN